MAKFTLTWFWAVVWVLCGSVIVCWFLALALHLRNVSGPRVELFDTRTGRTIAVCSEREARAHCEVCPWSDYVPVVSE